MVYTDETTLNCLSKRIPYIPKASTQLSIATVKIDLRFSGL